MKIAFCVWYFPKISETFILNQIIALLNNSQDVEVFACFKPSENISQEDTDLEILVHKSNQLIPKSRIHYFDYKKPDLFWETIKDRDIDIIHFQFHDLANYLLKCYVSPGKYKIFVTVHSLFKLSRAKDVKKVNKELTFMFRTADYVLPVSEYLLGGLVRLQKVSLPKNMKPEKTPKYIVHKMAINSDFFEPRHNHVNSKKTNLSFVGRFVKKKGILDILKAVNLVIKANPNFVFRLTLAGDGKERGLIDKTITKLGLQKYVRILGKINQQKVKTLLGHTDIFIHPSKSVLKDEEGIPVSIMEAMSMKIPVISTYHAGIPELVKNDYSGFLVKEGDISGICNAIIKLTSQPLLREKLGKNGRLFVQKNHEVVKQVGKLIDYYKNE